jgi:tetratricopeptide (TPR) repeat protein
MDQDGPANVHANNIGALRVEGDQYNYFYALAEQTLISNVEQPPSDLYVPRQAELTKLANALTTHPGVSLTSAQAIGEGGYGKTWLARAFAHQFRDRYPGGIFELRCGEGAALPELLADLLGPQRHSSGEDLTREERAFAAYAFLSGQKPCLLILDNVEDEEQLAAFRASQRLPVENCHLLVTTRAFDLPHLPQVPVGRLTDAEAATLLAKYVPNSTQRPDLVQQIITEAECMAVLIAAVGASLKDGTLDDMAAYVEWLTCLVPEPDSDGIWASYPQKSGAIFHDLYRRLEPASVRALQYAALFPPDQINPDDLRAVLAADQSDPELAWRAQVTGALVSVDSYLRPLRDREIISGPEADPWSLHRLHRRTLIAQLTEGELTARLARLEAQGTARFNHALDAGERSSFLAEYNNYSDFISIMTGVRDARLPRSEWSASQQNKLAAAYVNRGNALTKAQDLASAIADYGVAIPMMTAIRDALSPSGEWSPYLQNELAKAHMNRGVTHLNSLHLDSAITDFGIAISIMTAMRADLLPLGKWSPSQQSTLAWAYVNRGLAYKDAQELTSAIADFDVGIAIGTGIREAVSERGEWTPYFQNGLADAYMNRGNGYRKAEDLALAIADFDMAIKIKTGIRDALLPRGEWSKSLQESLAGAHINRGVAFAMRQNLAMAILDFEEAITIMTGIRDAVLPLGEWSSSDQNEFAGAYLHRGNLHVCSHDLTSAIQDFGTAIMIRSDIRDTLLPRGQWYPRLQNDLANAHMNRGVAYWNAKDLTKAIADFDAAIITMSGIRDALVPECKWSPALQNDLATAHMNRGNAYQSAQDLASAIADFGVAIRIRTGIREALLPRREWSPSLQSDLAMAHVNRGIAYWNAQVLASSIADFDEAISIMVGIRENLVPKGEWSPSLQNKLANAHMNRGNAYENAQDFASAIADFDLAISIHGRIRDAQSPHGEWSPSLQNNLAQALLNRGVAHAHSNDVCSVVADWSASLTIVRQLVESHPEFAVDVHRVLANWSVVGEGLTPDHVSLALNNLERLQTHFDAPTRIRLDIPRFNQMIASGVDKVVPALTPTGRAAALLGSE